MPGASRSIRLRRGSIAAVAAYVLAGVLLGGWYWASFKLSTVNVAAILAIATVGWVLAFGLAGQLSLGHAMFFGVGAYGSAILTTETGVPLLAAVVVAALGATVVGAVLAFPLLRVRGLFLAIATLGLALIAENIAVAWREVTGGVSGLGGVPGWELGPLSSSDPQSSFILLWTLLGLFWLTTRAIWRSPFGKATATAAEDEGTAASLGLSVRTLRAKTFTLSTTYAGVSGALFAHYQNFVAPTDVGVQRSIDIVVYGIVGGVIAPVGGVIGTQLTALVSADMRGFGEYRAVLFGVLLVLAMVVFDDGIVGQLRRLWRALTRSRRLTLPAVVRSRSAAEAVDPALIRPAPATSDGTRGCGPGSPDALRCTGVAKRYGGVAAVDGVNLAVARGEVFAIIGPNGAGKTTLLNLVSRFIAPDAGSIEILGHDALRLAPDELARYGVRRTFQTPHVVDRLSVLDNIAVGVHDGSRLTLGDATVRPWRGHRLRREALGVATYWAERFGIADELDKFPREIGAGHQRLVELARAMSGSPALLLLDEPAAGLNSEELENFTTRLRLALDGGATTAIVIDHQMSFIQDIADRVLVLDRGRPLAQDKPEAILNDERVIEAYLGGAVEMGGTHVAD